MRKLLFIAFLPVLLANQAIAQCTPVAPYSENFDGASWVSGTGFSNTGDAIDGCWSRNPATGYFFGTRTGTTGSSSTGPSDDFTGGGKYIFTEGSNGSAGDIATITSPAIDLSALTIPYLTFYYHMYGDDITSLEVDLSTDGGSTWTNEVSIVGQQQVSNSDPWKEYNLSLSGYAGQTAVLVRFSTTQGPSFACDVAFDEFSIIEQPTCVKPKDLIASNITSTAADIGWTSQGTETMWNIEYGPTGFVPGTGTNISVTTNPHTITGLTPTTSYDVYVQADCGGGDLSFWVGPHTFTTACVAFTAPFLEAFTISALPNCWDNTSSNTSSANGLWEFTGNPGFGANANGRPSGSFAWTDGSSPEVADITLLSPLIDMSALTVPMISFDWFSNNTNFPGDNVPLAVDINDGSGWTNLITLTGDSPDWQDVEIVLNAYANQTVQFRFICDQTVTTNAAQYNDILLDSVEVVEAPSCPMPHGLTASNITQTAVDLNWTPGYLETSWNIEYGLSGFAPGTGAGTVVSTGTNPTTLTGLTSATGYDIYIQANCGPGDQSTWFGPISIFTDCGIYSTPYYENFDGNIWNANSGDISPCWTRNPISGFAFETNNGGTPSTGTGPSDDFTGGGNYVFTEGSSGSTGALAEFISPEIDLSGLTAPYLTFYYHMYGLDIVSLEVDISTDGGITWNNEASIIGQQQTSNGAVWRDRGVDLGTYFGQTIMIRFSTTKGNSYENDLAVDEITVQEAPSCPKPISLEATNITDTDVTLSWIAGGSETLWNIEYGPTGFTPGAGTTVPVTTNPFTVTGLTPQTGYDFYIQANCGGSNFSDWSFPITVTTQCIPFVAPYLQPFSTTTLPSCWNNTSSYPGNNGLWEFTGNPGFGANANGRPSGSFAWTDGTNPEVGDITLLSPLIDMSPLTLPMISFDWFSNNTNFPGDNVPMMVDINDGSGWTNLITLSGDSPYWQNVEVVLAAYTGQTVQFRFVCDQTATINSAQYNDILLDSVLIDEAPQCPKPWPMTVSNITTNGADISWNAGYLESQWIIEYGPTGFVLGTGNTVVSNNLTEILAGLSSATNYEVYVRGICAPGDSSEWTGPASFTTLCDVYPAPFVESFQSGNQPICWDNISTGTASSDFWKFSGNPGSGASAANNGRPAGTFAWSDGSGNEDSVELITPYIDLSTITDPYLLFDWFSNNTTNPGDNVPLYIAIDDGTSWVPLDTLQGDNVNWLEESYDLTAFANTVIRVRFTTNHNVAGTAFYNDILVDEVRVFPCNAVPSLDASVDICTLEDTLNLNSVINVTPQPLHPLSGKWSFPTAPTMVVSDSLLDITSLPAGTYPVYYIIEAACTSDTTVATVNVYPEAEAGLDNSFTVCLNEPVDLNDGLTTNADLGGVWYDPNDNLLPNSEPTTPAIPSIYNYDYVTTNGVCPADTSIIKLIVDGDCNYLFVKDETLGELTVFPNPVSDVLNIANPQNAQSLKIEILDMNGRLVLKDDQSLSDSSEATITVDHLEKGVYTLRIYSTEGQKTFKVVKQ